MSQMGRSSEGSFLPSVFENMSAASPSASITGAPPQEVEDATTNLMMLTLALRFFTVCCQESGRKLKEGPAQTGATPTLMPSFPSLASAAALVCMFPAR